MKHKLFAQSFFAATACQYFIVKAFILAAFSLTILVSFQTIRAQSGLVSYWPGDGNANDVVGGNNGTLHGAVTYAPGRVGQAFSLAGGYIEVADSPSLSITGPLTLEAWIKTDPGGQQAIMEKYDAPGHNGYYLRLGARIAAGVCNSFTCEAEADGVTLLNNSWHHVAAVYDGTSVKVYLDGALDGNIPLGISPTDGSTSLKIGARGDDANTRFNGLIDEVKIYNRALTASEIQIQATSPSFSVVALFDQAKAHKSGSTIPIKIQILDSSGNNVSNSALAVVAVGISIVSDNAPGIVVQDAGNSNPDGNFRFDQTFNGYIHNLGTGNLPPNKVYKLYFKIGDSPGLYSVEFQIK